MRVIEHDPNIVLTNPVPTEDGKFNGRITNDIYTKHRPASAGMGAIEGALTHAGFKVRTEDSRFYDKYGVSTDADMRRLFQAGALLISSISRTADPSLDLARQYKEKKPNNMVIAGGFGPTLEAERYLRGGVDIVVRGEGEVTGPLVMKAMVNGDSLENMLGISYKDENGEIRHNPDRPLLTEKELSKLPLPSYPDYIREGRTQHVVNESRGCPGKCSFCCIAKVYKGIYRYKDPERVVTEIKDSKDGETVFFVGDNLGPKSRRADSQRLAETLIEQNLIKPYVGQVDASFALGDINFLKIWKKAGLYLVFKGMESLNPESLKDVGKAFTPKQNIDSTNILRGEGIGVHDMMIFAIPSDTLKYFEMIREYFRKENKANTGQLCLMTPFAGTPAAEEMVMFDFAKKESNLLDGQHLVTYPPSEFTCAGIQDEVLNLYLDLFNINHLLRTTFHDLKGLFSRSKFDRQIAQKLIKLDIEAHLYARQASTSMKKDPYYQNFKAKLKQIDDGIAIKNAIKAQEILTDGHETTIFEAKK